MKEFGERLRHITRSRATWVYVGLLIFLIFAFYVSDQTGTPILTEILGALAITSFAMFVVLGGSYFFRRHPAIEVWLTRLIVILIVGSLVAGLLKAIWEMLSPPVRALVLVVGLYFSLFCIALVALYVTVRVVRAAWNAPTKR